MHVSTPRAVGEQDEGTITCCDRSVVSLVADAPRKNLGGRWTLAENEQRPILAKEKLSEKRRAKTNLVGWRGKAAAQPPLVRASREEVET